MLNLRIKLIKSGSLLPLTPSDGEYKNKYFVYNPTWLEREDPSTHPYFRGPFTKENVRRYHIYCSFEKWLGFGKIANNHWDYRGINDKRQYYWWEPERWFHVQPSFWTPHDDDMSYNPTARIAYKCAQYLPLTQRKCVWSYRIEAEIFDCLFPRYDRAI